MTILKVSIGRTYNTGNYTSLRLDVGLETELIGELEDGDFDTLYSDVKSFLAKAEKDQGVS